MYEFIWLFLKDIYKKLSQYNVIELLTMCYNIFYKLTKWQILILSILGTSIFFCTLDILVTDKGIGAQNMAYAKRYLNKITTCNENLLPYLLNIDLTNHCSITLYGDKQNQTLSENQGEKAHNKQLVYLKSDKEYQFCKDLYNEINPSNGCIIPNGFTANTFTCNKDILLNDNETGAFTKFARKIFSLEKTNTMQSITFRIDKTFDKITGLHTKSLLIILNHNKLTNLKCMDNTTYLVDILNNRITIDKDPERLYRKIDLPILDKIKYNMRLYYYKFIL
jgi:hypothetical protein